VETASRQDRLHPVQVDEGVVFDQEKVELSRGKFDFCKNQLL